MRPSVIAGLFGLVYVAVSFAAFVNDEQMFAFFFMGAAVVNSAASFICLAIERYSGKS